MGIMIQRDMIKRYDDLPASTKPHYVIQSWDTAIATNAYNDYSACITLVIDERDDYYVVDVLRDRVHYPELKARALGQAQKHKPTTILIEEAGIGKTLIKDLKALGLPVTGVFPEGDKSMRVSIQLEKFTKGQVFFPKQAPWLADFESELFAFPNGRHDDQVDAFVQALTYKRSQYLSRNHLEGLENFANSLWWAQRWSDHIQGF
jgi:predicted phage terminase large subunit-like protein